VPLKNLKEWLKTYRPPLQPGSSMSERCLLGQKRSVVLQQNRPTPDTPALLSIFYIADAGTIRGQGIVSESRSVRELQFPLDRLETRLLAKRIKHRSDFRSPRPESRKRSAVSSHSAASWVSPHCV